MTMASRDEDSLSAVSKEAIQYIIRIRKTRKTNSTYRDLVCFCAGVFVLRFGCALVR
jgi:hypothetical protein